MIPAYLLFFSRTVLCIVFSMSLFGKISDMAAFKRAVMDFGLLPKSLTALFAALVIVAELSVVVLVLVGDLMMFGFALAVLILVVFSLALVFVLVRRARISCNCFGPTSKIVSFADVGRNAAFILCALVGLTAQNLARAQDIPMRLAEYAIIGAMAVIFVILFTQIENWSETFRQAFSNKE